MLSGFAIVVITVVVAIMVIPAKPSQDYFYASFDTG